MNSKKIKHIIEILSKRMPVRLMAFDLLYVRGRRITQQPRVERRQRLPCTTQRNRQRLLLSQRKIEATISVSQPLMNIGVVDLQEPRISVTLYTSKTYLLSATETPITSGDKIQTHFSAQNPSFLRSFNTARD